MDDGSQLRLYLGPQSSDDAADEFASSATRDSIDYKCSKDISPRHMSEYQGAYVRI